MPRHVRFQRPDTIYFVTHRTHQARYLFRPDDETNRLLRGSLCRAAAICDIDVFAFVYMSNHFHLIVRAPELNLNRFMQEHNREVARRINIHRDRSGSVFEGRYQVQPILDEASLRDKIGYTLCNPVEARAVSHPNKWPGVTSMQGHNAGREVEGQFLNYRHMRRLIRRGDTVPRRKAMETYDVQLAKLPWLQDKPYKETANEICRITESYRKHILKTSNQRGFKGIKGVKQQSWQERPEAPKRSPEPWCHTTCSKKRIQYRRKRRRTTEAYRQASRSVRAGREAEFPFGTIPFGARRAVGYNPPRGSPIWPQSPRLNKLV